MADHSPEDSAAPTLEQGACPICRENFDPGEQVTECVHCRTVHHLDCWEYNGGCGKFGCASAPPTIRLEEMEIPPSYWGKTEKHCPICQKLIQAAALRCRFCGATFDSARPLNTSEFQTLQALKVESSNARGITIWLLIFAVIPCTSPLAAIIGGFWYMKNRMAISQLPAQQAAIPRIALFIAVAETVLLALFATLHAMLGA